MSNKKASKVAPRVQQNQKVMMISSEPQINSKKNYAQQVTSRAQHALQNALGTKETRKFAKPQINSANKKGTIESKTKNRTNNDLMVEPSLYTEDDNNLAKINFENGVTAEIEHGGSRFAFLADMMEG